MIKKTLPIDVSLIPPGNYCYHFIGNPKYKRCILTCPYWDYDSEKDEQQRGYCHYLKCGDWEENGTLLLWDQVKECEENVNDEFLYNEDTQQWEEDSEYNNVIADWAERMLSVLNVENLNIELNIEDINEFEEYIIQIKKWIKELRGIT